MYTMRYRRAVTNHAILMNIREWNARQIHERINAFFKRLESQLLSSQNSQKLTGVDNTNADSVLTIEFLHTSFNEVRQGE